MGRCPDQLSRRRLDLKLLQRIQRRGEASFLGLPLSDPLQYYKKVSAHFFLKKALFSSEMLHIFVNLRLQR